jgi:hypothetical protein
MRLSSYGHLMNYDYEIFSVYYHSDPNDSIQSLIYPFLNKYNGAGESVNYYLKNFVKDFLNNNF